MNKKDGALFVALQALGQWASLIKHQYTGTQEAMSDLQHADNTGQDAIMVVTEAMALPDQQSLTDEARERAALEMFELCNENRPATVQLVWEDCKDELRRDINRVLNAAHNIKATGGQS